MVKKVTLDRNIVLNDIPGAKNAEVACNDTSCHLQCTCDFADSRLQYINAMNYFFEHKEIWNKE